MTKHSFENSSSISHCEHDDIAKELHITFHSGSTHTYKGVMKETFEALKSAESAGKFFHAHIKNKYQTN